MRLSASGVVVWTIRFGMNGTSPTLGHGRRHLIAVTWAVCFLSTSLLTIPLSAQTDSDAVLAELERIKKENEKLRNQLKQQTETVDSLIKRIDGLEKTAINRNKPLALISLNWMSMI